MKTSEADAVFDVLVRHCGQRDDEDARSDFIYAHREDAEYPVREYRFMGSLGFGGKFWSDSMRVSCYLENETPERVEAIRLANAELARLSP